MESLEEQVKKIFSVSYNPICHPSRRDDVKAQEAIVLIARKIDSLKRCLKNILSEEVSKWKK